MLHQTQADHVFRSLRKDILGCRYPPSSKIKINEVCKNYGVSLGAAREALSRLSSEGMVRIEPQRGFSVSPISRKELEDLTQCRVAIEQLCLKAAIDYGDVEWETRIVAAYHRLSRIPEREPSRPEKLNEAWSDAHSEFHSAIVSACPNECFLRLRATLYLQSERYRHWSVSLAPDNRQRTIDEEHKAIMEAVVSRDKKGACNLIKGHFERTTADLLALAEAARREIA